MKGAAPASYIHAQHDKLEAHYRPKQDVTVIMTKPEDLDASEDDSQVDLRPVREKLPGLIAPYVETEKGQINIAY